MRTTPQNWYQRALIKESAIGADFQMDDQGTLIVLVPLTPAAHKWMEIHLPDLEDWQRYQGGFVVEHRCIDGILEALKSEGMIVVRKP